MNITLQNTQTTDAAKPFSYDEIPYISYPYISTHPAHLMSLGILFGMSPVKLENARILELGCAGGGNLIPHALNYPKTKCVGVDLSQVQIDMANKERDGLGLKNIEFHCLSIMDIDHTFGQFDYILCHGVFSWVPKEVQDKILTICKDNLSENGIACISYNTLPGWNSIRTIRDMMLYHSTMFAQTQDKVTQARLILDFIKDSLEGVTGPHADMMRVESAMLANQPDNYLRHDHLSENNTQFYLHEFATRARAHNLQYLSDCNISGMYLGNLAPKVAEKLKSIDDVVKVEQYIDFLTNRRFRYTLLCHNTIKLNRNLNADDIAKFNMVFNLTTEKELADIDINDSVELLKFFHRNNKEIFVSTSSPYMKAILYSFYENHKNPISYDQLLKSANKKLGDNKLAEITSELINNAMQLVLKGFLEITCLEHRKVTCSDDKPKLAKLPFYQVTKTDNLWVTNLMHELIPINSFDKIVFKYMDGKHDKNAIIERTIEDMSSSGLVLREGEVPITNKDDIGKAIETALDITISRARANALFV